MLGRWYLSAAALREFMRIAGIVDDDGGPEWGRAEVLLGAHCQAARDTGRTTESGAQIWRTGKVKLGGRSGVRLELYVMTGARTEGSLPQLVRVRAK